MLNSSDPGTGARAGEFSPTPHQPARALSEELGENVRYASKTKITGVATR